MGALATAIEPSLDDLRFTYGHAIAPNSQGQPIDALTLLGRVHTVAPNDGEIFEALVSINIRLGWRAEVVPYAERLRILHPDLRLSNSSDKNNGINHASVSLVQINDAANDSL